jgi:hypothetical protein
MARCNVAISKGGDLNTVAVIATVLAFAPPDTGKGRGWHAMPAG